MGIRHHGLLLKFDYPSVGIGLYHSKAGHVHILLEILADNGNIRFFLNMVFQDLIVIQLINSIAGSDHHIRLMAPF